MIIETIKTTKTTKTISQTQLQYHEYIEYINNLTRGLYIECIYNDEYIYKHKCMMELLHWLNEMYKHDVENENDGISIIIKNPIDIISIDVISNLTGEIIYSS